MIYEEQLLKQLVRIPSVSGDEGKIGVFLFNLLKKEGFRMLKIPVSFGRFNIVATLGKPTIYFSAHLDTVPPELKFGETDPYIFGRGSCDTKASIASMVTAASVSKRQGLENFGLIFTVGEETVFDGVKAVINSKLEIPFVVVGEPTSLKVVNGHFGIMVIKITAKGRTAHSSTPQKGINAIDLLVDILEKVRTLRLYPETLMSVVKVNGGLADNVIPGKADAVINFRISPNDSTDYFAKIKLLSVENIQIEKMQEIKPVFSKVPGQLSFIKSRKIVKYCTELSFYKNGVVLGPGDIKYAHGEGERISKAELSKAVVVYTKIIKNFTG